MSLAFAPGKLATIASDDGTVFAVCLILAVGDELVQLDAPGWKEWWRVDGSHPEYKQPRLRPWQQFDEARLMAQAARSEARAALEAYARNLEAASWQELQRLAAAVDLAADLKRWISESEER